MDCISSVDDTVNSLLATTSRNCPPHVSDHFVNNRFVSQSNTVSKTLVSDHCSNFLSDHDHFLGHKFDIFYCSVFLVSDHLR